MIEVTATPICASPSATRLRFSIPPALAWALVRTFGTVLFHRFAMADPSG